MVATSAATRRARLSILAPLDVFIVRPRPEHNSAAAPRCKATVAVELRLVAPEAAIRQLLRSLRVHGFDEGRLDALQCRKFYREHGKQISLPGNPGTASIPALSAKLGR